jgi:hypothetical protein
MIVGCRKQKLCFSLLIVLLSFTYTSGEEKILFYSDQDLQKYQNQADDNSTYNEISSPEIDTNKASVVKADPNEAPLQKLWCRKGTHYRKKLDLAKERYEKAKKDFSDKKTLYMYSKVKYCTYNSAKSHLRSTEERLSQADRDLRDIENEAHRNAIPPGWLRCQF